ncbi:MAG: hypothetical protein ACMXYL_02480 [Candidatus Woesearchaeota archaeon]
MVDFNDVFRWMADSGVYSSLIPFFLVFTIVFAFMQKVKVFGGDSGPHKKYNIIVSLAIALIVIIPHVTNAYPAGQDPVEIFMTAIPGIALWIVAIMMGIILLATFGLNLMPNDETGWLFGTVTLLAFAIVGVIFGSAAGWIPPDVLEWLGLRDPAVQTTVVVIGVLAIILFFILGDEKKDSGKGENPFLKAFGESYKGLGGRKK